MCLKYVLLFGLICGLISNSGVAIAQEQNDDGMIIKTVMDKWKESETSLGKSHIAQQCYDNALVTFIMPTSSARNTLQQSIASLVRLKDCNWRLIVVHSDILPHPEGLQTEVPLALSFLSVTVTTDPRIRYLWSQTGLVTSNYGGSQRNLAFPHVTTPWTAFLDDDDIVSDDYIDHLRDEIETFPSASSVLFRMACPECKKPIIPPPDMFELIVNHAGISFAIKSDILNPRGRFEFTDGPYEDFHLLQDLISCEPHMVLSGAITYLVKGAPRPTVKIPSVLLNGRNNCRDVNYFPFVRKTEYFMFNFPEEDNIFFKSNIQGLKQALFRVHKSGCVDSSIFNHIEVEVHFGCKTPSRKTTKRHLIQVQMEQIHNLTIPNDPRKELVFGPQYVKKMQGAAQVINSQSTTSHIVLNVIEFEGVGFLAISLPIFDKLFGPCKCLFCSYVELFEKSK
jgi:hypothetical protein